MKISYREVGGVAGLRRGADLDLESLPPTEASRLRRLVERACLGDLEVRGPSTARDLVGYEIAIENDDGKRIVARFDDAAVPESAKALIEALRKKARPIPLRSPASPARPADEGRRGEHSPGDHQGSGGKRGRA